MPSKGGTQRWPGLLYRDIREEPFTWEKQQVLTDQIQSGASSLQQMSELHIQPASIQASLCLMIKVGDDCQVSKKSRLIQPQQKTTPSGEKGSL